MNIEVFADPSISIVADDLEVCLGETVDLTASVSGGIGTCDVQWQRRPVGGTWLDTPWTNPGPAFLSAPGIYQYRAIYECDGASCNVATSNVINIEVFADPEITLTQEHTEVCLGEPVDVTAAVSGGTGNCAIQWQRRPQGGTWANFANGQTTITALSLIHISEPTRPY